MESRIKVLALFLVTLGLVGCAADAGPNDPVVSGEEVTKEREKMIDEKDRAMFQADNGPGGPQGKGR